MDIFFCDVCCARVTANHLSRGHGVRNGDVIICGSCLEKGHGAELLDNADQASVEAVAAAPRLAGAEALDESRDRAATMKNLETASESGDDLEISSEAESEDAKESSVIVEAEEIVAKAASEDQEEPIDLSEIGEGDKITELPSEPELDMDSPDELEAVDVDDAERNKTNVGDDEVDFESADDLDDAIDLEPADNEVLEDAPDEELDEEPSPGSSHISADDAIDDLDDSGTYEVPDQNRLEDADDGDHTDSYSADELAAIRRLAEKEKAKEEAEAKQKKSDSGRSPKTSGRQKKSGASRKSGRKATASSSRRASASPKTSGRSKTSSRQSRKTSTRANASQKQGMPMPLLISFITIPIIIILFVAVMPGKSDPGDNVKNSGTTSSDLSSMARDVLRAGNDAYNSNDLAKLRKVMAMYGPLAAKRDRVTAAMEANDWTPTSN